MAKDTDIRKYTIDGVEIPVYPIKITCADNLVSRSWNNMYAQFIDIPVNLKYKVNWSFQTKNKKEAIPLLKPLRDKIINQKSRFFTITTTYPGKEKFQEMKVYLGTPISFDSLDWETDCGDVNVYKFELHWIETDGEVLIDYNNNIGNIK